MAEADIPSAEESINSIAGAPRRGQYKIIRVDGTEAVHQGKISIAEIERIIGCTGLDIVTIDRRRQTVMFVDDTGMLDGKPVNPKATELYRAICKAGTVWAIHGDVVIVPAGGLA
jgi:hypothetical protein